jgi:ClpP class serine protease
MSDIWCCELEHLRSYASKVLAAREGDIQAGMAAYSSRGEPNEILSVEGGTATIRIEGTLTDKVSGLAAFLGFGGTTYGQIMDAIARVDGDPSISSVKLAINSPGGNIVGLDDIWIALRDLGTRKQVVAENRGMIASAAYWIASAASRIVAISPAAMTGSIGVQAVLIDRSKATSADGTREIRIVSKNAPDKNPDPGTPEGEAVYQEMIDSIERVFLSRIAEGRGMTVEQVAADFGQGRMLIAQDPDSEMKSALSVNMIDAVLGDFTSKSAVVIGRNSNALDTKGETTESSISITDDKDQKMTLKELLASDPVAKAEFDALEAAAYQRGKTDFCARTAQASAILAGDTYPVEIRSIAESVLRGEKAPEELTGAASYCDTIREAKSAKAAVEETAQAGATPPEPPKMAMADGEIRTEEDHKAAVNRIRAAQGLKEIK